MSAVVKHAETAPAETSAHNILSVIERAALNPDIDIEKMQRLLDMQERIIARQAKDAYQAAFSAMQPELPVIEERGGIKDRNGNVQSTYALWEDVNTAIRPVLAKHGFGLSFRTKTAEKIHVTGVLSHKDGHSEETTIELMADVSGSKNAVQAIGSSVSYGKRYTAFALLNLSSTFSEDGDGQSAIKRPTSAGMKRALEELRQELSECMTEVAVDNLAKAWGRKMNNEGWPPEDDEHSFRSEVRRRFAAHREYLESITPMED